MVLHDQPLEVVHPQPLLLLVLCLQQRQEHRELAKDAGKYGLTVQKYLTDCFCFCAVTSHDCDIMFILFLSSVVKTP